MINFRIVPIIERLLTYRIMFVYSSMDHGSFTSLLKFKKINIFCRYIFMLSATMPGESFKKKFAKNRTHAVVVSIRFTLCMNGVGVPSMFV